MKCSGRDYLKYTEGHLYGADCIQKAEHINYDENIGFCDEHFILLAIYQREALEKMGKFYPACRELKLVSRSNK